MVSIGRHLEVKILAHENKLEYHRRREEEVRKNQRCGAINRLGKVVIPIEYERIQQVGNGFVV